MGEFWMLVFAAFVYLMACAICIAGYSHQKKNDPVRLLIGLVPIINIPIAMIYLYVLLSRYGQTVSGVVEDEREGSAGKAEEPKV